MRENRLIFAPERGEASLAPIYLALLVLVAVSLLGFAIALWSDDPAPARPPQGQKASGTASGPSSARGDALPDGSRTRKPGTWM